MGERVSFKANGRTAAGYLARPKGNGPGVTVIQEWWGLVPHIENVAIDSRRRASSLLRPISITARRRRRRTRRAS